jgi:glycosyltransferase
MAGKSLVAPLTIGRLSLGVTLAPEWGWCDILAMRISIVTATWNAAAVIGPTVRSVRDQAWPDLEHLLQDNCSRDETVALALADCPAMVVRQEADTGVYDAFNRGWRHSTGELVAFLNAGDHYLPGTLAAVSAIFAKHPEVMVVHGQIEVCNDGVTQAVAPRRGWLSLGGARIYHPATFMRRTVLEQLDGFDERYRLCADLDLFLRATGKYPFYHLPRPLTHFALGGMSTVHHDRVAREMARILRCRGYAWPFICAFWLAERGRGLLVTLLPPALRRALRRLRR